MRSSIRLESREAVMSTPVALPRVTDRGEYVVRFDVHQRLQHLLMMSSFITLALTGFPQKFSQLAVSQSFVGALGGLETVRNIHRGAGFVMLAVCVYHVSYLMVRIVVQRRFGALRMIPQPKDAADAYQMICYFLGLAKEKPKSDRFSYVEKFDYWAVFWGIAMMGGSGLTLMFAVQVAGILPGDVIPLAHTIHSDEAVLAVGWILVVHMFNAHLAPGIFPFNPAIFTGKLTKERYAHEHPLEYERLVAADATPAFAAFPPVGAPDEALDPEPTVMADEAPVANDAVTVPDEVPDAELAESLDQARVVAADEVPTADPVGVVSDLPGENQG